MAFAWKCCYFHRMKPEGNTDAFHFRLRLPWPGWKWQHFVPILGMEGCQPFWLTRPGSTVLLLCGKLSIIHGFVSINNSIAMATAISIDQLKMTVEPLLLHWHKDQWLARKIWMKMWTLEWKASLMIVLSIQPSNPHTGTDTPIHTYTHTNPLLTSEPYFCM